VVNEFLLDKLHRHYTKHKNLIIAVDFDDTICASVKKAIDQCIRTRNILKFALETIECQIVIYTARQTSEHNLVHIDKFMSEHDIDYHGINENVIDWHPSPSKIYYNILLDDKSGLLECQDTLEQFLKDIQTIN
jgi:hypothetical protein